MHSGHCAEEVEGGTQEIKVHFFKKEFKRQFEKNSLFVKMVCPLRNEGSGFIYTMMYFLYVFNIMRWRRQMRQGQENLYFLLYFLFSFSPLTLGAESQPCPPVFPLCSVLDTMLGLFMGHIT